MTLQADAELLHLLSRTWNESCLPFIQHTAHLLLGTALPVTFDLLLWSELVTMPIVTQPLSTTPAES